MPADLRLVWNNPLFEARQHHDLTLLRMLGDFLAGASRCGYIDGAKQIASIHKLTPLAASVVSKRMLLAGMGEADVRKIV